MTTYKGFSTLTGNKKFRLTDLELVKRDLLNHFYTRKGERVMQPDFGTSIWDILFDPQNEFTQTLITDEVSRIIATEPRINARNVNVTLYEHGIQIEVEIESVATNQVATMTVTFDQRARSS